MISGNGLLAGLMGLVLLAAGQDETESPLQSALRDSDPEGPWHYNDLPSGFAEAKATGKPLLIVFR
jgi:hypothetical protein